MVSLFSRVYFFNMQIFFKALCVISPLLKLFQRWRGKIQVSIKDVLSSKSSLDSRLQILQMWSLKIVKFHERNTVAYSTQFTGQEEASK